MSSFFFTLDWRAVGFAFAALAISTILYQLFTNSQQPHLSFSFLKNWPVTYQKRSYWINLPYRLKQLAAICLLIAFIDPHFMIAKGSGSSKQKDSSKEKKDIPLPTEGIALYLDLDQSGSMNQTIETQVNGKIETVRKIDMLKQVTAEFIKNESTNLIGLITFARIPQVLTPLTLDQDTLLEEIKKIDVVKGREEDGTSIGYAIFKTAHLIAATRHFAQELREKGKPAYEIKGSAIIVVTDGLQDPNPLDEGNRLRMIGLEDAATYTRDQGIRLYIINIDPTIAGDEYAPHRRQLNRVTEMTGGKFYLLGAGQSLQKVYADIDSIEKGKIMPLSSNQGTTRNQQLTSFKGHNQRFSLYPFFIALGLLCLFIAILLETTLLRKIP